MLTVCVCVCVCTLQADRDAVHVDGEEHVASYLELQQQLAAAKAAMRAVVNQPRHILPFLQPGRLVNIAASASGTSHFPSGVRPSLLLRALVHIVAMAGRCTASYHVVAEDELMLS